MLIKFYRTIVYLLFFCLRLAECLAQQVPEQFRFQHITVNEGLSHSDAMCVAQDKNGFIWVGTNKGIDRYDGYKIRKYDLGLSEETGVSANRIRAVHISNSGFLWVGAERAGLYWYDADHDKFAGIAEIPGADKFAKFIQQLSQTNVLAITSDKRNHSWIATRQHGVFVLRTDQQGKLVSVRQIRLNNLAEDLVVNKLVSDSHGNIWIGTWEEGLWFYENKRSVSEKPSARATKVQIPGVTHIRALHLDRRGDLWVGGGKQVFWVEKTELPKGAGARFQEINRKFAHIESLFLDSQDRLWISTTYGLLLMNGSKPTGLTPPVDLREIHTFLPLDTDPFSINSIRVHDILEDRFHNLWFATSAGGLNLLKLGSKPFGHLRRQVTGQSSPADNYINAIYQDNEKKTVWIGTRNGFASYNMQTKTYQNFLDRQLSGSEDGIDVSAIFKDSKGTLWVGTRYAGLYTLNSRSGSALKSMPAIPNSMNWRSTSIENILEDKHGTIWVATFNAGIHAYHTDGNYVRTFDKTLPTKQFTALCYDKTTDILWGSTRDAGLVKMQISGFSLRLLKQFRHEPNNPNSLKTNYTWPLLKDKSGNLWIGTIGGGLHKLSQDPNGREIITRFSPLIPETDIESILSDDKGNIWIGGAGLYQFDPVTKRTFYYDVSDGLQSNSFKIGAAFRNQNGIFYFGGTNGVTYFDPNLITPNKFPPIVQITGFRVLNKTVEIGEMLNGRVLLKKSFSTAQDIRIQPKENDFSIEFTGLNYANPQKQQYAYKLDGYHVDWIKAANGQRSASFSNLPPGQYKFSVKASNDDGLWSAKPATLNFVVLPPWYRTWWAYLIYTLLIVSSFLFYRQFERSQQALKNSLALETYKVEKEKELSDIKLRFFTNVSHELRTPLTLILGPVEELASVGTASVQNVREKMLLVQQQIRKLLDLVNQLMEFRKVESGYISLHAGKNDVMEFLNEILLIFRLKAEELKIDYAVESELGTLFMYFDAGKLEIIMTNLLSNAFKFTPEGGKIRIFISAAGSPESPAVFADRVPQNNYLELVVRDWGIGMKQDEVEKIFDPYFQASQTDTIRMMGTGLGLSLVRQFVEAHSGNITVESNPGEGSTFTVRLPFGESHLLPENIVSQEVIIKKSIWGKKDLPERPTQRKSDKIAAPTNSSRILIVEDNDELRQYIYQIFSPSFSVYTAIDGIDGWEKAVDILPDFIISDVMMPRGDGLELCKKVKQNPKTMHIQVLLLTARIALAHELEGLETGADEYMLKPFHPDLLYTKVVMMLQGLDRLKEYYQRQILMQPTDVVIPDAERQILEKAMAIIEANLVNPDFNVLFLVKEMGMSQSTFYRQIKAISGQSAIEFISDVRVKRAAQLLATSSLRITEVANMVGFEDLKHFRKTFHNRFAVTPSEYIKQFRKPGDQR